MANLRVSNEDIVLDDGPQCYARAKKKDSDARRRRGWTVVIGRELR